MALKSFQLLGIINAANPEDKKRKRQVELRRDIAGDLCGIRTRDLLRDREIC